MSNTFELFQGHALDPDTRAAAGEALAFGQRPAAAVAETFPRMGAAVSAATLTAAQPYLTAIYLAKGTKVNSITFFAVAALATGTHQIAGLISGDRATVLAHSADKTSDAWSANSSKTFAMTAEYDVPEDGLYYVAIAMSATTLPTMASVAALAVLNAVDPAVAFTDTAHATTTAFIVPVTVSAGAPALYAYVA